MRGRDDLTTQVGKVRETWPDLARSQALLIVISSLRKLPTFYPYNFIIF